MNRDKNHINRLYEEVKFGFRITLIKIMKRDFKSDFRTKNIKTH